MLTPSLSCTGHTTEENARVALKDELMSAIQDAAQAATDARAALKKITTNVPPVTILETDEDAAECDKKTLGAVRYIEDQERFESWYVSYSSSLLPRTDRRRGNRCCCCTCQLHHNRSALTLLWLLSSFASSQRPYERNCGHQLDSHQLWRRRR